MKVIEIKTNKVEKEAIKKAELMDRTLGVVTLRAKKYRHTNTGLTKGIKTNKVKCFKMTIEQKEKYIKEAADRKRQRAVSCPYWERTYC